MTEISFLDARTLARRIANRELSPAEVAQTTLTAIERLNPILNAFLDFDAERALACAAAAEQRLMRGGELPPLLGVPVAIKDVEATSDYRTTRGSLVYREHRETEDSIHVARLRAAGAVIVGKTNTPEFALLGETRNRLGPECCNPWDTERTVGGSSGGSAAAVAAGLVPLATGTDTGGSITIPAGFCGVTGLKPTHRRIPVWPNAEEWPAFYDTGPIARSVDDAALALRLMAGHDSRDPESLRDPVPALERRSQPAGTGLRIAFAERLTDVPVAAENRAAVQRVAAICRDLGLLTAEAAPDCAAPVEAMQRIGCVEENRYRGHLLAQHRDDLEPSTVEFMTRAHDLSALDYAEALIEIRSVRRAFNRFFERFDVLIAPAAACPPFPLGRPPNRIDGIAVDPDWTRFAPFNLFANLTGCPLVCVPAPAGDDALPLGVILFGPVGGEATILDVARMLEQACPWTDRRPPARA